MKQTRLTRLSCLLMLLATLSACAGDRSRPPDSARGSAAPAKTSPVHRIGPVDSIVLERTACYGSCPAYRLRISRAGATQFIGVGRDSGQNRTGRATSRDVEQLLNVADYPVNFLELPDHIVPDSAMCGRWATDFPSATVTLFMTDGTRKSVEDYLGCGWTPESLRDFEGAIDSVAHTAQWLKTIWRSRGRSR